MCEVERFCIGHANEMVSYDKGEYVLYDDYKWLDENREKIIKEIKSWDAWANSTMKDDRNEELCSFVKKLKGIVCPNKANED